MWVEPYITPLFLYHFLSKGYPDRSDLLFTDTEYEITDEMKPPLYHRVDSKNGKTG